VEKITQNCRFVEAFISSRCMS